MSTMIIATHPTVAYPTPRQHANVNNMSSLTGARRFRLQIDNATPAAPAAARAWVRTRLAETGIDLDTAELVTSELVTNVVRHVPDGPATINLTVRAAVVVLSVADTHPEIPVRHDHGTAADDAEGGRGLDIVAALGAAWYLRRTRETKRIVARLPIGETS